MGMRSVTSVIWKLTFVCLSTLDVHVAGLYSFSRRGKVEYCAMSQMLDLSDPTKTLNSWYHCRELTSKCRAKEKSTRLIFYALAA